MSLLQVKNLSKSFDGNKVLNNLNISVDRGEILAITGTSGSGKTTLLRCLNFLERFDEGQIFLNGQLLYDAAEKYTEKEIRQKRLNFGFVFQSFNLFPQYTAFQNIRLALDYFVDKKRLKGEQKKQAQKQNEIDTLVLLEKLGLKDKANSYPFQLSGGQQQRVAIARALALKPTILCFDEPTSALDSSLTEEVVNIIESLKSPDRAILIVTHDQKIAARYKSYAIEQSEEN